MLGADENVCKKAFAVGEKLAEQGSILFYGACTGYPHEAVKGAMSKGGAVVGVSPALNIQDHIRDYGYKPFDEEIVLYTGLNKHGRDVVLMRSCDAAIIIGGAEGSLLEFCVAYGNNKIIGVLLGSGGVSDHLAEIKSYFYHKQGIDPVVIFHSDPEKLVEEVHLKLKEVSGL